MSLDLANTHCMRPFLLSLTFGHLNTQLTNQVLGLVLYLISLYQESELPPIGALILNCVFLVEGLVGSPCTLTLKYPLGDLTYWDSSHR